MQYWYNEDEDDEDEKKSEQYPFIINNLMTNQDVLLYTMLNLKGERLLAFCLSHPHMYKICQDNNFWKTKLKQEDILIHKLPKDVNYRDLYNILYFIRSILDDEITNQETDYLNFTLDKQFKQQYYMNLMQYIGITHKLNKSINLTVEYIDIWYKRSKNYYGITFTFDVLNYFISNITYQQILNFMFNAYIDGAITEIYNEF
jgi:hypothetical protein